MDNLHLLESSVFWPDTVQEYRVLPTKTIDTRYVEVGTPLIVSVGAIHRVGDQTFTTDEFSTGAYKEVRSSQQQADAIAAITAASDRRIDLLVRSFSGDASNEDDARLQILTSRLRKLSPRITAEEINHLDNLVGELEGISANLDDIEAEYGLK